jgi:hypothetical protein
MRLTISRVLKHLSPSRLSVLRTSGESVSGTSGSVGETHGQVDELSGDSRSTHDTQPRVWTGGDETPETVAESVSECRQSILLARRRHTRPLSHSAKLDCGAQSCGVWASLFSDLSLLRFVRHTRSDAHELIFHSRESLSETHARLCGDSVSVVRQTLLCVVARKVSQTLATLAELSTATHNRSRQTLPVRSESSESLADAFGGAPCR